LAYLSSLELCTGIAADDDLPLFSRALVCILTGEIFFTKGINNCLYLLTLAGAHVNYLSILDDEIFSAMAHPVRRSIIESLRDANLSFMELLNVVADGNHGKFGYHLRKLEAFVELEPSTKKYRLTHRGRLLAGLIRDFRLMTASDAECVGYIQHLKLGNHAVGFYDTEYFKRKISFPYLKVGLSKGEAVFHIVSEHELGSEMRELQRYMIDIDYLPPQGALTTMSSDEWFMKKGKAQPKTIIANWRTIVNEKRKAGFSGVRGAVEMNVMFNYDSNELLRLEAALGRQFAFNFCGLCLFDTRRLDSKQFVQLYKYHGHIVSKDILGKTIV